MINWPFTLTSRLIVLCGVAGRQHSLSPFPACPAVSFISPNKSHTGYQVIDWTRLLLPLLVSRQHYFFSLLAGTLNP